jgi:hypothetical protein
VKRKMMSRENVPNNSATNGGNGGYMNKAARINVNRDIVGKMEPKQTATGRSALSVTKKRTKFG